MYARKLRYCTSSYLNRRLFVSRQLVSQSGALCIVELFKIFFPKKCDLAGVCVQHITQRHHQI